MPLVFLALLAFQAVACSHDGKFANGVYSNREARFRIGAAPSGFKLIAVQEAGLSFYNAPRGATIGVNVTCREADDVPLAALRDHLVFGFTERKQLSEEVISLDGREALVTRLDGKLDGVPVRLTSAVLKKDACVYDFTFAARPAAHGGDDAAFLSFVRGFATLTPPRGRGR
ncbi:MAG: hypothetical protein HYY84_15645 [Deltaproteobacteria bacterium]|nr:hypothetical protein [Deltaproteobacteria bacterium]